LTTLPRPAFRLGRRWKPTKNATRSLAKAIALKDRRLMAMAGLWETWRSPPDERIRSFTIITTQPNSSCAELHNRTPAVLKPGHGRYGLAKGRQMCPGSRLCSRPTRP